MSLRTVEEVEAAVSEWPQEKVLDLIARLATLARERQAARVVDWSRYSGILQTDIDPLDYQHQIRAEWDDRTA